MIAFWLAVVALGAAAIPTVVFLRNLLHHRSPPALAPGDPVEDDGSVAVSILIPARDEEAGIRDAVLAALAAGTPGVSLEVVVMDDQSEDRTAQIVNEIAASDSRVRCLTAPPLPPGWCGKQHACARLAQEARGEWFLFQDADVRLTPGSVDRLLAAQRVSGAELVSGFPRQLTVGFLEKLLLPLIHFVLLGFLPMWRMRRSTHPSYGAGCGQLFLARRAAYEKCGGHGAIRETLHDGIKLPRAFRAAGFLTDLVDGTSLATCRMYRSGGEVWAGLKKNATEGLAAPAVIGPATLILLCGQVLPFLLLLSGGIDETGLVVAACVVALVPRVVGAVRFQQSWLGAALHPLGVLLLLVIQWTALIESITGRPSTWRGRSYSQGV